MIEVDNNAYNRTSENLSGWFCPEEEVLPSIQKGLTFDRVAFGKLNDIEQVIYIVYKMFLNGDI